MSQHKHIRFSKVAEIPLRKESDMTKYLEVVFENGDTFHVPAEVIAKDRAQYYFNLDTERGESPSYDNEYQYSLGRNEELEDWVSNNMNWNDLEPHAIKQVTPPFDYNERFYTTELRIITK